MTKHYTDEGTLLIRNSDIKDGKFEFGDNPIYLEKTFAEKNETRMHQIGDVITVHTGDVGTSAVITENEAKSIGFATIVTRPNPKIIDSNYLCSFLNTDKHKKWAVSISTGDGRTNYNLGDYFELVVPVPSIAEQKRIASYIQKLNRLITLHQRKCQIDGCRFQSPLAITWEQRKFDDITYPAGEKNRDNLPYESYSVTNENGFIPQNEQFENGGTMATADKSMYYIVSKNSFAYNPARINVGSIGYYDKPENVIVSSLYEVFKTSEDIDDRFLWHWFKSDAFQRMIEQYQEGGVRLYFYYDKLCMCSLPVPDIQEQRKIGKQLDILDNLITLHQRKYDKLTNVKKSMLGKMFPQNGSNVPEIRFKGFTEAWEQRKVGDLLIERNQQAPMSDEYPLMAFIANEGVAPKGDRYDRSALVTDTANKLYKKTEIGDFIYSSNNLETGSIGLNKYGKACISPVYSIFEPTGIADSDFLGRRLVRKDFINAMVKWRQGVIYGQWRIHESDFLKIEIPVPSVVEQRKIGAYLDQLDRLITLHQRELEKLKNLKKACLEKMFV